MANRTTHRIVNALALLVGGVCVVGSIAAGALMAEPRLAFAHSAGDGRITFHATRPLPEAAAERAAAEAWAALQDTPFGQPDHGIDVYVTGGRGWRHWLFFRPAPWAGGLTYPMLSSRNVFLRDVDLDAGRLVGVDGPVRDPRPLTYYLVHEITHLRHGEVIGPIGFLLTPHWVREGVPDLAALGPADGDMIARAMAGETLDRDTYGSYPLERTCVTIVLARPGVGFEDLLRIRAPIRSAEGCNTLPPPDSD